MPSDEERSKKKVHEADTPLAPPGWAGAASRGLSSDGVDSASDTDGPLPQDSFFQQPTGNTEPETLFDPTAVRPPRELKITREGDGRKLPEGHIINERFEVRGCLGKGNVGTVYCVDDLRLKDKKALKLMHPALVDSADAARRFISEIKALQQLSHENVVRIYDYGKTDGSDLSFFTMEYIEGGTLAAFLKKRGGKLPLEKATGIIRQILDTLAYAHQHTTHRNLKPINVMVRPTGKVVLLNFGISTTASSAGLGEPQVRLAHSHYQAPEQRENPEIPDKRVDIYAAGAIFYQMLTGNVPLEPVAPPSRLNPEVSRALDRVVMRCLAPRPEQRFPDAPSARAALDRALAPVSPWWKLIAGVAAAAVLAALAYASLR